MKGHKRKRPVLCRCIRVTIVMSPNVIIGVGVILYYGTFPAGCTGTINVGVSVQQHQQQLVCGQY